MLVGWVVRTTLASGMMGSIPSAFVQALRGFPFALYAGGEFGIRFLCAFPGSVIAGLYEYSKARIRLYRMRSPGVDGLYR